MPPVNRLPTPPPSTVTRESTGTTPSTTEPPRNAAVAPTSIRHAGGPLTTLAHLTRHGGHASLTAKHRGGATAALPDRAGGPGAGPAIQSATQASAQAALQTRPSTAGRLAATPTARPGAASRLADASGYGDPAQADGDGESVHAEGRHAHGSSNARLLAPLAAVTMRMPLRTRRRRHDPNDIPSDDDEDRASEWQPSEFEFNAFSKDLLGASGTVHMPAGADALLPNAAAHRLGETSARPTAPPGSRIGADAAGGDALREPGEIRSVDDLKRFIMETGRAGISVELGHSTVSPNHEMLYGYHGLVYHGATHTPREIRAAGGLFSGKPLDVDANLLEAQGLADPKGATGDAGISTSKVASGALARAAASAGASAGADRAYVYVIDTRSLDASDQAYDLTRTLVEAGHLPAGQDPDGHDDPTGAEVNATHIADSAIVGWVALDDVQATASRLSQATPQARSSLLGELVRDNEARVHLNDGRATMDD
ncbi:hypothetical protein [Burkholderia plantarii]|uniref:hypothetical protein n=1 Tax=Burkholderia plantarii TaxID=41899 RepID=UPI0006D8BA0E|nr:hypothetical protein [Burkholderia plantarii]GLZ17480.1 hypothetical protein Bpla01_10100 [Burkholderia plantarii]